METIVNLPDALFAASAEIAASDGSTLEQFIVEAVQRAVDEEVRQKAAAIGRQGEVELPVIRSKSPGKMDLSAFDFDELLSEVIVWMGLGTSESTVAKATADWSPVLPN